ncbi:MAG: competence protein TfoX [Clostridiales bacterium]|nr:competence protein TfoX [Clostridiales bacterium]
MASDREYLSFVLEQLSGADIAFRPMMGEYVVYCGGKVIGGVYDNRLLLKPTKTALAVLSEFGMEPAYEIPYPGAGPMLQPDIDNRELLLRLAEGIAGDLPERKKKK